MKLSDILKKVGIGIIKDAIPGGSVIMQVVNELLPKDKQLGSSATGKELNEAIESLPPEDKAKILEKQFDVDITQIKEASASLQAMLAADASSTHTTRPFIARWSFIVVSFVSVSIVSIWAYAVIDGDTALVLSVTNGWPMVVALLAPFFVLLRAYFGILGKESKHKLDAANGNPTSSIASTLISGFLSRK